MSIDDLRMSFLVTGSPGFDAGWDVAHRLHLVNNLEIVAGQLWSVGVEEIYADGSFVEQKNRPNDVDGYFVCDLKDYVSGNLERRLNRVDPLASWGWDAQHRVSGGEWKLRRNYQVEMFPYQSGTMLTPKLEMSQAFRQTKHGSRSKGIIQLTPLRLSP